MKKLTNDFIHYIDEKIALAIDTKKPVQLKPMIKDARILAHEYIRTKANVSTLSIGSEPKRKIVIFYKVRKRVDGFNARAIMEASYQAYTSHRHQECIRLLEYFISVVKNPYANVYQRLGHAYLKFSLYSGKPTDKDKAVMYLMIAHEKYKTETNPKDLSDIIFNIIHKIPEEDEKPTNIVFTLADFGVNEAEEDSTLSLAKTPKRGVNHEGFK